VSSTEDIEKRIKNVNIVIDSERNKKVFSNILQAFEKSKAKELPPAGPNIWRTISRSPITKIAAAAVIILGVSFFSTHQDPDKQEQPGIAEATKSPVEIMTAISLERAFRRGGIKAVEEQCKQAFKPIRPWLESSSINQILAEFNGNGKSSERTRP
jgi:hypothetical protein